MFGVATKNVKLFSSKAISSITNFPNVHVILAKCHTDSCGFETSQHLHKKKLITAIDCIHILKKKIVW